jgi:hypothetical protein
MVIQLLAEGIIKLEHIRPGLTVREDTQLSTIPLALELL